MPNDCGSTKPNTICAAIAASIGAPPSSRILNAARVARGCAVVAARVAGMDAIENGSFDNGADGYSAQAACSSRVATMANKRMFFEGMSFSM